MMLKGEMSLVEPHPYLFNQIELIEERSSVGSLTYHWLSPSPDKWNRHMSILKLLVETDARMLEGLGVAAYFTYIIKMVAGTER
jgi:O-antigen biosynthesis protein WbqP